VVAIAAARFDNGGNDCWLLRRTRRQLPFYAQVTFQHTAGLSTFARYPSMVLLNYLITVALVHCAVDFIHHAPINVATIGKIAALPIVALNGC
jgi:hypothetical protein